MQYTLSAARERQLRLELKDEHERRLKQREASQRRARCGAAARAANAIVPLPHRCHGPFWHAVLGCCIDAIGAFGMDVTRFGTSCAGSTWVDCSTIVAAWCD